MGVPLKIHVTDASGACVSVHEGHVVSKGTSTPASGAVGYAPGSFFINTSTKTIYRNSGTKASATFVALPGTDGQLSGSPLILDGITYTSLRLNSIEALRLDDAAISGMAAATSTSGVSVYLATQNGGLATAGGLAGGSLAITGGSGSDGSVGGTGVGGDGASVTFTAGSGGGASVGGGAAGGNAGNIILVAGSVGAGDGAGANGLGGFIKSSSLEYHKQAAPGTLNSTGTLTAALLTGGIVTSTTGAGVTATLDTGSAMDTALGTAMGVDTGFYWSVINTGGNTLTVTASSNHSIVGVATVVTVTSARFFSRRTATATWITYRV